jgi:RNA polymerase sigma-70 factor (ECF subfamily)
MTEIEFQYKLISLQDPLLRFAYSLTADEEDAKDLLQETFLKALKYCDKFVTESNFKAWTCTIMKNTFINNYHRSLRYTLFCEQSKIELTHNETLASASDNPDSIYKLKELEKIIETLDDDLKLPFKMHHQGYKYKDIAKSLTLNIGTVKSRIFVARKKLIKQLN